MKKRKKMRTFAKRLTGRIMLVLLIVMGLASFVLYEMMTSLVEEEETDLYEGKLDVSVQKVRRVLSDVYVATSNQVPMIEESLDQPDRMFTRVERLISLNPRIRRCGISVVADPSVGGTLSGARAYDFGTSCTLTATPAEGYTFVNWTEVVDDTGVPNVVSPNAEYTFRVTSSRVLVANFELTSP